MGKHLLLVEDERLTAMAEKHALEGYGYQVTVAPDGEQAVKAACSPDTPFPPFDLILMDINLGKGINGTEAAQTILAHRDIPILFLSSHTEPEIVRKTEQITSYGYLVKNSDTIVLDASIKMALKLFAAKKKAKENTQMFQQITESINEVYWLRNKDNTEMLYVSPSYETVWGRTCQDLYKNPQAFMDSVFDEDKEAVYAEFARYEDGGKFDLEYRITRPQGDIRWIRAQSFPVRNDAGDIIRHSGLARDITKEKEVRVRLENFQALVQSILQILPGSLSVMDRDFRLLLSNKEQFLLGPPAAANQQGQRCYEAFQGREKPCPWCRLGDAIREDSAFEEVTDDDDPRTQITGRYWHIHNIPFKDAAGKLAGAIEYGHDITEVKKAEKKALRLAEERNTVIQEMNHRIKNNLASISGLIQHQIQTSEEETVRNALGEAHSRIKTVLVLYEKLSAAPHQQSLAAPPYLSDLIQSLLSLYPQLPITLKENIEDLRFPQNTLVQLGTLVAEGLTNSLKYAFPDTDHGTIHVRLEKTAEGLLLEIRDSGKGLPEDFSLEETSSLGLSLMHMITEQLGGRITAGNDNGAVLLFQFSSNLGAD